jgi:hypothetical protein
MITQMIHNQTMNAQRMWELRRLAAAYMEVVKASCSDPCFLNREAKARPAVQPKRTLDFRSRGAKEL